MQPSKKKDWVDLVHKGVWFPPPYKRADLQVRASGKPVTADLSTAAHEAALLYHCYVENGRPADATFRANFWHDWRALLPAKLASKKLSDFEFVGGSDVCAAYRKALRPPPLVCQATVDGHAQPVGSCAVEGPGLFVGRGTHPSRGRLRGRILPEDMTLNVSKGKAPPAPPGHRWGGTVTDKGAWWLARWRDPVSGKSRYVWLGTASRQQALHDKEKLDFARRVRSVLPRLRADIAAYLRSSVAKQRQLGVVLWLLDTLALRVGAEGGDGRAVGVTALPASSLRLSRDGKTLTLDFPGKDSVRYQRTVPVPKVVSVALSTGPTTGPAFPQVSAREVNAYLTRLLDGLTARVLRTFHANDLYQSRLARARDVQGLRDARLAVAEFCNHRRQTDTAAASVWQTATSVDNYLDPRLTFAWARRHHVDDDKVFTARQLARFAWANKAVTYRF